MNYHQLEKLISVARWILQSKDRHLFQRLYSMNTNAAKLHGLRPQASTRERKQIPVPLTRTFYLTLVKIFTLLLDNFELFDELPPEKREYALTVVTDANRAAGVGHVYDELHKQSRTVHTGLQLLHEPTTPQIDTTFKFSATDEAETLYYTLQTCVEIENPPQGAQMHVIGDNEGNQVLLQKRKPSRNPFLTKVLDKIHHLTDAQGWKMTYTWMSRAEKLIKQVDSDGRLPMFEPQPQLLHQLHTRLGLPVICLNITEALPQWPRFPTPAWWAQFQPQNDHTVVLFALPPQLTAQAVDFIAYTFRTCPYLALLGIPTTKKYRLKHIFTGPFLTFALVKKNFKQIHKTHKIKYIVGVPFQCKSLSF